MFIINDVAVGGFGDEYVLDLMHVKSYFAIRKALYFTRRQSNNMRILFAIAALAVTCAAQNCQQNGQIRVCDDPPLELKACIDQDCHPVILYPKHWYAPLSQADNIRLRPEEGDSWTITDIDVQNCKRHRSLVVCDALPEKHKTCGPRAQVQDPNDPYTWHVGEKCHSYIVHPKHYYGPRGPNVPLNEGDFYQVTAFTPMSSAASRY